jgi:hypothetical protein
MMEARGVSYVAPSADSLEASPVEQGCLVVFGHGCVCLQDGVSDKTREPGLAFHEIIE